jgi:hypothetical protein
MKMRALSAQELGYVSGGSYFGSVGGGGLVKYRILGECPVGTAPGTDCYVVRADQQSSGMFDDDTFWEDQCQSAFQFAGGAIGGFLGGAAAAGAVGLEISIGIAAAPVTGGMSLAISVTGTATAAAQTAAITFVSGLVGNQIGTGVGYLAC